MSDFSFTSTAQCEKCGNYLSSSDEECDHDGREVEQHFFRHIHTREVVAVETTIRHKWYALERVEGDEWIAYEWLGPRENVQNMVGGKAWPTIDDVPKRAMSLDAPSDVGE